MEEINLMVSKAAFGTILNFLRCTVFYVFRAWSFKYLINTHVGRWRLRSNKYLSRLELHSGASKLGAATPEETALRRIEQKLLGLGNCQVLSKMVKSYL